MTFGQWHTSGSDGRFDARVGQNEKDTYPHPFKVKLEIKDKKTGQTHTFNTGGLYCGNFSPILIQMKEQDGKLKFKGIKITRGPTLPAKTKGGDREETPDIIAAPEEGFTKLTVEKLLRIQIESVSA